MRALPLLFLAACMASHSNAPPPQAVPGQAIAAPATEPANETPSPEEKAFTDDYEAAVTLAEKDDLAGAYDLISKRGAALETAGRYDLASVCWNTSTWVKWAQGDLAGAIAENDRLGQALARADMEAQRVLNLHYVWDRAYLFRDKAEKVPPAERAKALQAAEALRDEYHHSEPSDEKNGGNVLDAYFAWRGGDNPGALAAAKKVDLENDKDAQDLYVVALALEAGGDKATADRLRAHLGDTRYMMPPLLRHWKDSPSNR